jgi:hypothetical protein
MNKSEHNAKKKRGQWTEDHMKLAIDKVRSKEMSAREAADTFLVPRSSLGDRLTKLKEGLVWFRRTFTDELEEN